MLQDIKKLYGRKLGASDGDIGHVHDFYFDDKTWAIRYVVADTTTWLSGRQVLLAPHAFGAGSVFGRSGADTKALPVNLTRKQIEDSPSIDTQRPVSRQYEEEYHRYYGWPNYWQDGSQWAVIGFTAPLPPLSPANKPQRGNNQRDDIHLRSTKAVTDYAIQATDGTIGSVASYMVDDKTWAIRELVVETGHWFAGKRIFVLPENIERISYEDSTVYVNLRKGDIQQTTRGDVAQASVEDR